MISSESSLDQQVAQLNSDNLILKAELGTSKKKFEQLSDIHSKCRSQKEKISVGIQPSTDDEVTFILFTVLQKSLYIKI